MGGHRRLRARLRRTYFVGVKMDHAPALMQSLLVVSLIANGSRIGNDLVRWCRRRPGRLRLTGLGLIGLESLLFFLYVFSPPATVPHLLVFAAMSLNGGVLMRCFDEWHRTRPRPWGLGGAREQAGIEHC